MTDKNKDLGAQIEFSASADGMKDGVAAINKSIDSIGATAEYVGNKSSASLDKIGASAGKSAKQIAAATRSIARQADAALAMITAGNSVADRLQAKAQLAGADLAKLADKINSVRQAEEARARAAAENAERLARVSAAANERAASAKAATVSHGPAIDTFAEAQSRVFLAFKIAEAAATNQAEAAKAREAAAELALSNASERARASQRAAYETKVAYIAKVNEEAAALFRTKDAQRQLDAERAGVGREEAQKLAKLAGDREFLAGIYQLISAEQKRAAEVGKTTAEILKQDAAQRGLTNTAASAISRYESLAKANKAASESAATSKANDAYIASLERTINTIGKTRSEIVAMELAERGLSERGAPLVARLREVDEKTGQLGKSAFATRNRLLTLQYTISDIAASAASGISPLTILLQQGGQVFDAFGGANAGGGSFVKNFFGSIAAVLTPMRVLIGGVVSAVGALGYAFYEGSRQSKAFADALVLTGNYAGITEGQFNSLVRTIAEGGQVTVAAARQTAQALLATGEIGKDQFAAATEAAGRYEKATGKTAAAVAAEFAALSRDVAAGAATMNRSLHFLTTAQVQQIQALQDQGRETQAFGLAIDALNERLKGIEPNLGFIERALRSASNAWSSFWDAALDIGRTETVDDRLKKVRNDLKLYNDVGSGLDIFGFQAKDKAELQQQERELLRQKDKEEGAAAAKAAEADLDRRATAASNYYRTLERGAKTQKALARELAEEERNFQALRARRATDPNVEVPDDATRAAIQKKIRDSYADKGSRREANSAAREAAQVLKAQRDAELAGLADSLRQERSAYSFQGQYLSSLYQQSLISLDDYYAQRKKAAEEDGKAQADTFAKSIRVLEKYRDATKDPSDRTTTQTKIDQTVAAAQEAEINRQREAVSLDVERASALRQLGDRVSEYRAQMLQLQGDEAGAAKIRTDLAIANAKLFATTAGGRISDAEVANQERLLRIADAFGEIVRRNTQLTNAAATAERAYLLSATQAGASLRDIESGIYEIRARAVAQLGEQARAARELAAANAENVELQQRAADLTQQYADALYTVDPALTRLRDSARSTAEAITNDIANAVNDFKGFKPLIESIGNDLLRATTDLLVTQPLKVTLEGLFRGIAEGDNPLGNLLKDIVGVKGTGALDAQTAAVSESTLALISLTNAASLAAAALGGNAASSGSGAGVAGSALDLFSGVDFGQFFHAGGIVGVGGETRQVPTGVFAGARRMHRGGLASGEVPAILMGGPRGRREEVLAASDPRHVDNGGRAGVTQTFHITIAPPAGMTQQTSAQFARDAARQIALATARGNA